MRKQNSPLSVLCFLLAWIILGSSVSPYAEELRPTDSVMGDLLPNAVTAAEQTKNILYLAKATAQNIEQILPAQISFSSSSLSLAACAPCTDMPVSSYNSFSFLDPTLSGSRYTAELYLDCSKLSPGITGKKVFEYRFNTTAAAQTAFNALSIDYTLYSNNGSTSTRNQGLTLYKVFMGDINGDGAVNTADALMAQQAAVGKIPLTETQTLAADIDGDKKISTADALKILQAAVGKIKLD